MLKLIRSPVYTDGEKKMFAILLAHSYQVFIQVSNTHALLLDYSKDHVTNDFVEQHFLQRQLIATWTDRAVAK